MEDEWDGKEKMLKHERSLVARTKLAVPHFIPFGFIKGWTKESVDV